MKKINLKKLFRIIDSLGISIEPSSDGPKFKPVFHRNKNKRFSSIISVDINLYKLFFLLEIEKNNLINTVAHEIGHYLVCPPNRRRKIDYGIPEKMNKRQQFKYELEELKAQAIEYDIIKRLGGRPKKPLFYKQYPNIIKWYDNKGKVLVDTIFNLAN